MDHMAASEKVFKRAREADASDQVTDAEDQDTVLLYSPSTVLTVLRRRFRALGNLELTCLAMAPLPLAGRDYGHVAPWLAPSTSRFVDKDETEVVRLSAIDSNTATHHWHRGSVLLDFSLLSYCAIICVLGVFRSFTLVCLIDACLSLFC